MADEYTEHPDDAEGKRPDKDFTQAEKDDSAAERKRISDAAIQLVMDGGCEVEGVRHVFVPADAVHDPALPLARLYAALALAQGAFPEIPKNRTATIRPQTGNPWEFMYSDLSDLINATRPALTANGLAVFQVPDAENKNCITTLAHSSGLILVGSYPIHHKGAGRMHPGQDWAISWAFARRYGLSALLGIAAEETVEGDQSDKTTPDFDAASGDGRLGVRGVVVPPGTSKAFAAKLLADGIEAQFGEAKTAEGREGVWKRNLEVINVLQDHFPGDYQNVIEAYEMANREREDEA